MTDTPTPDFKDVIIEKLQAEVKAWVSAAGLGKDCTPEILDTWGDKKLDEINKLEEERDSWKRVALTAEEVAAHKEERIQQYEEANEMRIKFEANRKLDPEACAESLKEAKRLLGIKLVNGKMYRVVDSELFEVVDSTYTNPVLKTEGYSFAYVEGWKKGVTDFAIWKDGDQLVGCTQKPLKGVLEKGPHPY